MTSKEVPNIDATEAAKRLLEALRQAHKKENTSSESTVKIASIGFGLQPKDDSNDLERKRMTLRLETVLVEYLRGFTSDTDGLSSDYLSRVKRSAVNSMHNSNPNRSEKSDTNNGNNANVHNKIRVEKNHRVKNSIEIAENDNTIIRQMNKSKSVCPQSKQRVTQLDRNELASAIKNISNSEHNIRNMLNYRYFN